VRKELIRTIEIHQTTFGLDLPAGSIERLADYYELIQEHNEFLNLVGPTSPEGFATRHILESLTLLKHLPQNSWFADVGTGGGLPAIPCLLARDGLKAVLIESKERKAKFLEIAVEKLGLAGRTRIVNKQFQEVDPANCQSITCRALDKFTEKLPRLVKWSAKRQTLLFGGNSLRLALDDQCITFTEKLMPLSEQRFLFVTKP